MGGGQGSRFSRVDRRVTAANMSIIARLTSRAVVGRDLHLQVHQHQGFTLHLVWEGGRNGDACIQRRFIYYSDVSAFCRELIQRGCQGLYSCVSDRPFQSLPPQFELCLRTDPLQSDCNDAVPRWWAKLIRDCACFVPEYRYMLTSSQPVLEWSYRKRRRNWPRGRVAEC
jgi:hypothetical protein